MSELPEKETDVEHEDADGEDNTVEVKVSPDSTDNVGDVSVEINVEELLNQIEEECGDADSRASARRRLDEIMESKRAQKELDEYDDDDYDVAEGS